VKKLLGEGGKRKVYLTNDNTLDRDVAFALIKTENLDEDEIIIGESSKTERDSGSVESLVRLSSLTYKYIQSFPN